VPAAFGAGIVRKFAAEGARVLVVDINADGAASMAEEVGNGAGSFGCNVADGASVAEWLLLPIKSFGQVDILVNNAGITHLPKPMEEVTEDEFDRVFAVNCKSVYLTARELVPHMKANGGAILNVASTAGLSRVPS